MIIEVRNYRTKPGRRAEFVDIFQRRTGPAQIATGMRLIGPLLDVEAPDALVWLRSFPSLQERDRIKEAFYDGATWKHDLEGLVMPLLEDYSSVLTTASRECFDGPLRAEGWT